MAAQIIRDHTSSLVSVFSECILTVSDHCLAKELITDEVYNKVLESSDSTEDKARILLNAIKDAVAINNDCFDTFIDILNLPEVFAILATSDSEAKAVKPQLVAEIEEKYDILKKSCVKEDLAEKEQPDTGLDHPTSAPHVHQDAGDDITHQSAIPSHEETSQQIRVIQMFTPKLVSAISGNVHPVLDECSSNGLITEGTYKKIFESENRSTDSEDKARFLLQAIKGSIRTDKRCFKMFVDDVLKEKLPPAYKDQLTSEIMDQLTRMCPVKADDTAATQEDPQVYDIKTALAKVQELTEKCAQVSHEKKTVEKELATKVKENEELKTKLSAMEREGQHEEIKQLKEKINDCESEINELNITKIQKEAVIQEYRMLIKREGSLGYTQYKVITDSQRVANDHEEKATTELETLKFENSILRQEIEQLNQQKDDNSCCYHCSGCHHYYPYLHHRGDKCGFLCRWLGCPGYQPPHYCCPCPLCKHCHPDLL